MKKIYESKLFIILKNGLKRNECKISAVAHKDPNNWTTYSPGHMDRNVGLKMVGISAIDIDNINSVQLKLIYDYINVNLKNWLILETYDQEKNKYGCHIIFRDKKNSYPMTTNFITPSGHNCDIRSGVGSYIVFQIADFEGNRLENAAPNLFHKNNLALEELDELSDPFIPVKRTNYNHQNHPLDWSEGSRNISSLIYASSLYQGRDELTLQMAIQLSKALYEFQPELQTYPPKAFIKTWENLFEKFNKDGKRDDGTPIWRSPKTDKFIAHRFIDHIKELFDPKFYKNNVYIYDKNIDLYIKGARNIKRHFHSLDNKMRPRETAETYQKLIESLELYKPPNEWWILLNTPNQRINVINEDLNFQQIFPLYKLKYDYDPKARKDREVERFLKNISQNDKKLRSDIIRALSIAMVPKFYRRIILFKGSAGSGKSTLIDLFNSIWLQDDDNRVYSTVSISDLEGDKFTVKKMVNSLYNVSSELPNSTMKTTSLLKAISGGDNIDVREMYSQEIMSTKIYSQIIMTSNHIIKFADKSGAMEDRVVNIPIEYHPKKQDVNYIEKLTTESGIKYFIKLLVEELFKVKNNKPEFLSEQVKLLTAETEQEGDPLRWFIKNFYPIEKLVGYECKYIFEDIFHNTEKMGGNLYSEVGESTFIRLKKYIKQTGLTRLILEIYNQDLETKQIYSERYNASMNFFVKK